MIDGVQLILLVIIISLSVMLIVLGVQVFFILKQFRGTLTKVDKVLDNTEIITDNMTQPTEFIASLFQGTQAISQFLRLLTTKRRDRNEER